MEQEGNEGQVEFTAEEYYEAEEHEGEQEEDEAKQEGNDDLAQEVVRPTMKPTTAPLFNVSKHLEERKCMWR